MATIQIADKPTLDRVETKVDVIKAATGFSTIVALPKTVSVSAPDAEWHSIYKVTGAGKIAIQGLYIRSNTNGLKEAKIKVDGVETALKACASSSAAFIDSGFSHINFLKFFEVFVRNGSTTTPNSGTTLECLMSGLLYM